MPPQKPSAVAGNATKNVPRVPSGNHTRRLSKAFAKHRCHQHRTLDPIPTQGGDVGHHRKERDVTPCIARRGGECNDRLWRHRWVVERTHARFAGMGKLRIRFERRIDIHLASLSIACSIICLRILLEFLATLKAPVWRKRRARPWGSTPKSRAVLKELQTSDPVGRSFAASLGCGIARCSQTHSLVLPPVWVSSFDRSTHA